MKKLSLLLLFTSPTFATSVVLPLPPTCPVSSSNQLALTGDHKGVIATCDGPTPPATSCTQGAKGDVLGYTAKCTGTYVLHSGTNVTKGPFDYTFPNVFGSVWPGSRSGTVDIFTVNTNQFISVPFIPTPGHSIVLSENDTFTKHPLTFSVSTVMGAFNNGKPGNGVICAHTNNPSLIISSNGEQGAQCPLELNKQYWFNVIPAYYSETKRQWFNAWLPATSAQFGVNYQGQN